MKRLTTASALALTAALSVSGPAAAQSQPTTGPVATYWVTAQTSSGLPGMGGMGGGGGGFNPMAMMSGGGVHKTLTLQLQSSRTTASPHAEHLPPASLGVGPSLPLTTPDTPQGRPDYDRTAPQDYGGSVRMLIYHGCGEATGAGQPVVMGLVLAGALVSAGFVVATGSFVAVLILLALGLITGVLLVLPVGGIKEKVVAAAAAGLTRVMLPARNKRDYDDIPAGARAKLEFIWLERVDDAIAAALEPAKATPAAAE